MKKRFTGNTRIFLIASVGVVLVALLLQVVGLGLNLGVDFTGGTQLIYAVGESYDIDEVRRVLDHEGYDGYQLVKASHVEQIEEAPAEETPAATEEAAPDATAAPEATAEPAEATPAPGASAADKDDLTDLQIRLDAIDDPAGAPRAAFESAMAYKYPGFALVSEETVGATAGSRLVMGALKAALIALVCVLAYIALRFDLYSAAAALDSVVLDVALVYAFMVFFRGLFPVNAAFLGAVLFTAGLSLVGSVVLFGRVREGMKKPGHAQQRIDIVETCVAATLNRTLYAAIAILIALLCLFFLGVSAVRQFTFPMIVGVLASAFTSTMITGQIWAMCADAMRAKKAAQGAGKKKGRK